MARKPSPWYREERDEWCVTVGGKHHRLGPHPPEAPRPKKLKTGWNAPKAIRDAFHKLAAGPVVPVASDATAAVLDDFLTWCYENRAARTAARYHDFIQDFVRGHGRVPVGSLTSAHVTAWLADKGDWNATTKRNAITALARGFNWAVKNRGLGQNPIKGMEKPQPKTRTEVIAPVEFDRILALVRDAAFRDLLVVSYDSGARPQEVKRLEARHLQLDKHRAVIPAAEAKGQRAARTIYLPTERSVEVLTRLAGLHADGAIFRNNRGNPWTAAAVKCRFEDIEVAIGREEMERRGIASGVTDDAVEREMRAIAGSDRARGRSQPRKEWALRQQAKEKLVVAEARRYGKRFRHYALRHSFVTRKLVAGVDSHIVAALAGHTDTSMIDRVYSHVADDHAYMLAMARKDVSPGSGA